ncbi:hypothetical protein [Polyangium mundeleinium]|uniref:WD40 repeat domain-containing protein n=1 Tax=Polyangium mundeleinium TaxID=2995306 RepID=A0ABT5EQ40_9BACT|nr:hypothetical protein [Polyangium mundeleinium]MDC0743574.1 hypothetical protein [Polyangium mundeleinium]
MRARALPQLLSIAVAISACAGSPAPPSPPPLAAASATPPPQTPAPPPDDAPPFELSRVELSPEGTRIVAWQGGAPMGASAPLCVVQLASQTPVCVTLRPSDPLDGDPKFSARGTYLAMRTRKGLLVRETAHLRTTFQKALAKGEEARAFAQSPNERLLAWIDARGAARVLDMTTGTDVMSAAFGGPVETGRVLWSGDERVVVAADGYAPQVWDLAQNAVHPVDVPGATWRGYEMAIHGSTGLVAGGDALVAQFDLLTGRVTALVRPPAPTRGSRRASLSTSASGGRFAVTLGSQIDVFDASPPGLVVSVRVADGEIMGAALSPDGSRMGFGLDRTSFAEGLMYESHTFPVAAGASPKRIAETLFLGWLGHFLVTARGTEVVAFDGDTMAWLYDTGFVWAEACMLGGYAVSGGTALRVFDAALRKKFEMVIRGPITSPKLLALPGTRIAELPRNLSDVPF